MKGLRQITFDSRMTYMLLLLALPLACNGGHTNPASARGDVSPSDRSKDLFLTVDVSPVIEKMLDKTIQLSGDLVPYQFVELFPKVNGFVESISVDRGSRVSRGQLLITITAPELTAQRAELVAKLHTSQSQQIELEAKLSAENSTYQRLKSAASTTGVISGNELEIAQKKVEASQAHLKSLRSAEEAARSALRAILDIETYLQIVAPFDGMITQRNVHPGAFVGSSGAAAMTPMLRLEEIKRLRLVVAVPEKDVAGLTLGNQITFRVSAYPGESFHGTIQRIPHSLDIKTRTMPVELDVTNADGRLAPGMFCEVLWPIKRSKLTLFVPTTAVVTTTERLFVIRINEGSADWVDIKKGETVGEMVEVFGPLSAGDLLVTKASDELRPGTMVKGRAHSP
jgi:membrane fusion protein (multidrug efflux system)